MAQFEEQYVDRMEGSGVVKTLTFREAIEEIGGFTQLDEVAIVVALNQNGVAFPGGKWVWSQGLQARNAVNY